MCIYAGFQLGVDALSAARVSSHRGCSKQEWEMGSSVNVDSVGSHWQVEEHSRGKLLVKDSGTGSCSGMSR